ncbi:MAG: hypothetical protein H0U72_09495 [Nitrosospira sp.]|nr:hypothetical protein [Nitrosospira sp.]
MPPHRVKASTSNPLPFGNPDKLAGHPDGMVQEKKVILTWIKFDGNKTQLLIMQSDDEVQTWSMATRKLSHRQGRQRCPHYPFPCLTQQWRTVIPKR